MIRPPKSSKTLRDKSSDRPNPSRLKETSKKQRGKVPTPPTLSRSTDSLKRPRDGHSSQPILPRLPRKTDTIIPSPDEIIGSFDENSCPHSGFIILRHVSSPYTNNFWIRCYRSVRKYHPHSRICIIDDGSDADYVKNEPLPNTIIVSSSYRHRGELLPYIYLLDNDWFNKAAIIHDSTYLNKPLDFTVDKYKFLWNFKSIWDRTKHVKRLMSCLDNSGRLIKYYESNADIGCFGAMSIIERKFLLKVDEVYDIKKLLDTVNARSSRMHFERVLGGMLRSIYTPENFVVFGDIHKWQKWGRAFEKLTEREKNLPIVKYWCGR